MKRSISLRTFTTSCFGALLLIVQLAGAQVSNFDACRYGYPSCDSSQLTGNEQTQVAVAAHARNFDACRYGYPSCDRSQLTGNEQAQVAVAAHAKSAGANQLWDGLMCGERFVLWRS